MKIWKGLELEGEEKGFMTLFVSGAHLDSTVIINTIQKNPGIRRVYLGGGRINVSTVTNVFSLSGFCLTEKISLVVETTLKGIKEMPEELFDEVEQVIVRFDGESLDLLSPTDVIKIDTGKDVYTIERNKMIRTNLAKLDKDMFNTDDLIYDDAIGGYVE